MSCSNCGQKAMNCDCSRELIEAREELDDLLDLSAQMMKLLRSLTDSMENSAFGMSDDVIAARALIDGVDGVDK